MKEQFLGNFLFDMLMAIRNLASRESCESRLFWFRQLRQICRAGVLIVASLGTQCDGGEFFLTPESDVEAVAEQLQAGDLLVLKNGVWSNVNLKFEQLPGTLAKPIRIQPESPGGVTFAGESEVRLSGTYVIFSGFAFRDIQNVSDVLQLRSHSQRHAHNCRVTDCLFEQSQESKAGIESRWLSVYGTSNRVDHCYFSGKKSRGTTLVVWVADKPGEHRIDHNYFGPRPVLGRNGGETIRIGTSEVSERNCKTIVEENYFFRCNGEAEIISNKSCENIYRHNVFDECSGALTLRHGHRCVVEGNVFLGRKARGTGGVRIIGRDHTVINNYFEGLRGDEERAAICMMNGIPDGALNTYAPVVGALVAHNSFIDCKVTMEIGLGAGKTQSAAPIGCQISHNIFHPVKWHLFRMHSDLAGVKWIDNLHQPGKQTDQPIDLQDVQLQLKRSDDGLLRPTDRDLIRTGSKSAVAKDIDGFLRSQPTLAGCDDPGTKQRMLASPQSTNPSWRGHVQ